MHIVNETYVSCQTISWVLSKIFLNLNLAKGMFHSCAIPDATTNYMLIYCLLVYKKNVRSLNVTF